MYCCVLDVLRAAEHVISHYFRMDGLMLPLKGRTEDTNRCGAYGRVGGFTEREHAGPCVRTAAGVFVNFCVVLWVS